jgi:hypothetical protein
MVADLPLFVLLVSPEDDKAVVTDAINENQREASTSEYPVSQQR